MNRKSFVKQSLYGSSNALYNYYFSAQDSLRQVVLPVPPAYQSPWLRRNRSRFSSKPAHVYTEKLRGRKLEDVDLLVLVPMKFISCRVSHELPGHTSAKEKECQRHQACALEQVTYCAYRPNSSERNRK
jgi:hypothetical protein